MAKTHKKSAKSARKTSAKTTKAKTTRSGLTSTTARLVKMTTASKSGELPPDIERYLNEQFDEKTHLAKFCGSGQSPKFLIVRVPSLPK